VTIITILSANISLFEVGTEWDLTLLSGSSILALRGEGLAAFSHCHGGLGLLLASLMLTVCIMCFRSRRDGYTRVH
jgi:hypothetical protein